MPVNVPVSERLTVFPKILIGLGEIVPYRLSPKSVPDMLNVVAVCVVVKSENVLENSPVPKPVNVTAENPLIILTKKTTKAPNVEVYFI